MSERTVLGLCPTCDAPPSCACWRLDWRYFLLGRRLPHPARPRWTQRELHEWLFGKRP